MIPRRRTLDAHDVFQAGADVLSPQMKPIVKEYWRRHEMERELGGRVALVTGGASGIGKVTAQLFAREGAKVVVVDTSMEGSEETVRLIRNAGGEGTFMRCDVAEAKDVEATVNKAVEIYGSLDYAFNNAGIGPDGARIPVISIVDCPEELWNRTMAVNLTGVFLCIKYEMRQMLKQKYGAIVNTSSIGAFKALPGFGPYCASKTGLFGLTKAAALEGAASGIRVNTICPALTVRTSLYENLNRAQPDVRERMADLVPMRRLAEPEEMAEAVIWLCSDAASFVTGHIMPVDGGMTSM
jgi:NAD(P)-dependent dehydrogenase (short-subunit alcohol dehydrogenase family)